MRINWYDFHGEHIAHVGFTLGSLCDPSLRELYSSEEPILEIFEKHKQQWIKAFQNIHKAFPSNLPNPQITKGYMKVPSKIENSGQNYTINLNVMFTSYEDTNYSKLLSNKRNIEEKIRKILEPHTDLALYVLNIIDIKMTTFNIEFYEEMEKDEPVSSAVINLNINMEMIHLENYYKTIGEYKLIWENVCVKNKFSNKGIKQLAKELNIDVNGDVDNSTICKRIGDKIKNLRWRDFEDEH